MANPCGNASVKIVPDSLKIEAGQEITIRQDWRGDPAMKMPVGFTDWAWTQSYWRINGVPVPGYPPSIPFKQDNPGTYTVGLQLETRATTLGCIPKDTVTIEVGPKQEPAPPPPVDPTQGCPPGQSKKNGVVCEQTNPITDCGSAYVHIRPDLLRVAVGQQITIGQDYHYDPDAALQNGVSPGFSQSYWKVNGEKIPGNPPSIQFVQSTPGTYVIDLALMTGRADLCLVTDQISIEVLPACPEGQQRNDEGNCAAKPITCDSGFQLDPDTNTCKAIPTQPVVCDGGYQLDPVTNTCIAIPPPLECNTGFTLNSDKSACVPIATPGSTCPTGTYNSNGSCIPIGGAAYNDTTSTGYDRLSSNYQAASSFMDVFKTPETDTKSSSNTITTSMLLIGGAALVGIGGFYYMSTSNVGRRNYR